MFISPQGCWGCVAAHRRQAGSHRHSGALTVGDYPALRAALSRREQSPRAPHTLWERLEPEAGAAVDGTGFAGVRG